MASHALHRAETPVLGARPGQSSLVPDRQRSSSVSDLTPRASHRLLPAFDSDRPQTGSSLRTLFGAGSASGSGGGGGGGGTAAAQLGGTARKSSTLGIREAATSSGRASPVPSRQNSAPTYNLSSRSVAAALSNDDGRAPDDVWQAVCVRVLPLFNGEGHRGYVEDLNDLVSSHVQRTFARQPKSRVPADTATLVTGLLTADLSELLSIGFLTLSSKLAPSPPTPPLDDEKLLARLNEVWNFFLTGLLPHLEAVFWVLRCDDRLKAIVGGTGRDREREGRTKHGEGRIDVRRLALLNFRDHLILPQINRIASLFRELYLSESRSVSRQPSPLPPHHSHSPPRQRSVPIYTPGPALAAQDPSTPHIPVGAQSQGPGGAPSAALIAANARRRQMVAILASLLTADDRQAEMDGLLRSMRAVQATPAQDDPAVADGWPNVVPSLPQSLLDMPLPVGDGEEQGVRLATSAFQQRPRARAWTMDSLDEEVASQLEGTVGGASVTPVANQGRRRGFLPRMGRTSKAPGSTIAGKPISGPVLAGDPSGDEEHARTSPIRFRSTSGRGEESESTAGSER